LQVNQTSASGTVDTSKIDELLARLAAGPQCGETTLVEEHVQGARTYLLGAMTEEYKMNLQLASHAAAAIPDESLRGDAERALSGLIEAEDLR
jgi:hypothetical protein